MCFFSYLYVSRLWDRYIMICLNKDLNHVEPNLDCHWECLGRLYWKHDCLRIWKNNVLWVSTLLLDRLRFLYVLGEVSYGLTLPPQLLHVHNIFCVSLPRGYPYHSLHATPYSFEIDTAWYVPFVRNGNHFRSTR